MPSRLASGRCAPAGARHRADRGCDGRVVSIEWMYLGEVFLPPVDAGFCIFVSPPSQVTISLAEAVRISHAAYSPPPRSCGPDSGPLLGDCVGHRLDVAVGGAIESQNLGHYFPHKTSMFFLVDACRGIDHQNVCIFDCHDPQHRHVFDGSAISGMNLYAVDVDRGRRHQVCEASAQPGHIRSTGLPSRLALSTRAQARMGSASWSLSLPLARTAKQPEDPAAVGHGCIPQAGEPPCEAGSSQIRNILTGACSRLYSLCLIPVPALKT